MMCTDDETLIFCHLFAIIQSIKNQNDHIGVYLVKPDYENQDHFFDTSNYSLFCV